MTMLLAGPSGGRSRGAGQLGEVLNGALGSAAARLSGKVDDWTDRLDDVASGAAKNVSSGLGAHAVNGLDEISGDGSAKQQAVAKGVVASVRGKNPLWAALKGAWSGGNAAVKAAIVAALVGALLLLVLSPVLLLVFLVSLLILAAVAKARSARR